MEVKYKSNIYDLTNENNEKESNISNQMEIKNENISRKNSCCSLEGENFLDKIISLKKNVSEVEKSESKEIPASPRRSLLRKISFMTNLEDFNAELSDLELENKIKDIHIKPDDLKTQSEKDLHILEKIGLNCIFTKSKDELEKKEQLQVRKEKYVEFHNKIIVGNQLWVEKKKLAQADFFEKLAKPQKPKYLVIACSDSRVVVNEFTATEPGDVFTHRNIGNLVISTDFNCQSVLQFAVDYLKVEHILVIGHTDCGAVRAALSYDFHGLIDHWLKNIREVAEKHGNELRKLENEGHEKIVKKLIELNIKEQCLNLCKSPIIQGAWDRGQDLYIHGYVFEMESGILKDLEVVQRDWSNIQEIYKYNFKK